MCFLVARLIGQKERGLFLYTGYVVFTNLSQKLRHPMKAFGDYTCVTRGGGNQKRKTLRERRAGAEVAFSRKTGCRCGAQDRGSQGVNTATVARFQMTRIEISHEHHHRTPHFPP
jgi:hypothetical protein